MSVHDEDVKTLLNDLIDRYGYDFTGYAEASLKRRINRLFELDRFPSFAEFRFRILNDAEYFRRLVEELTVNITEMLRDPLFYKAVREEVIPVLEKTGASKFGIKSGEGMFSYTPEQTKALQGERARKLVAVRRILEGRE